nr:MAG TPA: hypothetical protein [Caudoviricetes sp.]
MFRVYHYPQNVSTQIVTFLFTFSTFRVIFCSLEDKVWLIFQRYLNNLD